MILDSTYFQGELHLPSLEKLSSSVGVASMLQTVSEGTLEWFVVKYEREFLINVLGYKAYHEFKEHHLVDGVWRKLKDALYFKDGGFSFSPAANYVYYKVRLSQRTQTSIQGEVIGTQSYANSAQDIDKAVRVWNSMCDMVSDFRCGFLKEHWDDYREYGVCRNNWSARKINKFGI